MWDPRDAYSPSLSKLYFHGGTCLLPPEEASYCQKPGDYWYQATTSGLAEIVWHFRDSAYALARNPIDIGFNSDEFQFMDNIGPLDMHSGLMEALRLYIDHQIDVQGNIEQINILVFVFSWIACFAFVRTILQPYIKTTRQQRSRIAELLSQLPKGVDVEQLITQQIFPRKRVTSLRMLQAAKLF